MNLKIHPSIGVARLGNSPEQFFLAPDSIGGLPYESDLFGNQLGPIIHFKDETGRIRRQGQIFKIYDDNNSELTLNSPGVKSIVWTAHLANKKAAWYTFSELDGNLLFGQINSYKNRGVQKRNYTVPDQQSLIIDYGWRQVSGPRDSKIFDKDSVPDSYKKACFPPTQEEIKYGQAIITLGKLITDDLGRLIVLGGIGNLGGQTAISSFGGGEAWWDDISDGPVYCTVTLEDNSEIKLNAWIIVGSPDFAPEITNISTLSDTAFDVGVRYFDLVPEMYNRNGFNPDFRANYQRDIQPIIDRMGLYQWVANVQPMTGTASGLFDFKDNSDANLQNRLKYFSYYRQPNGVNDASANQPSQILFQNQPNTDPPVNPNFPMLPLNAGTNPVSNNNLVKFLALNLTQYFLLGQWAKGNFDSNPAFIPYPVNPKDTISIGNCVGLPMSPGIEVSWSVQNPAIYKKPYSIFDRADTDFNYYNLSGLNPDRDECDENNEIKGCEPGDLTKRMATPWPSDFFQCFIQGINFTDPSQNTTDPPSPAQVMGLIPIYYAHWWPPQAPWDVLSGAFTAEQQITANVPLGQQINYARGINQFAQMMEYWFALAFIRNHNSENPGYPFFTETERDDEIFTFVNMPVSQISGNSYDSGTTVPIWYIQNYDPFSNSDSNLKSLASKGNKGKKMADYLEKRAFKPIKQSNNGLGLPRSGIRNRR